MQNDLVENAAKTILATFILIVCFGSFISCSDKDDPIPAIETGTVTDADSNVYKTVKIGNQWWMAENLRTKKFRNGATIPEKQIDEEWRGIISAAYCNYNNTENNTGLLYNYYTVTDSNNISPSGWHVPTDDDWKELEKYLGMNPLEIDKVNWRGSNEGDKLKIKGPEGWTVYQAVWGTNESGFTALAGSCRMFNGNWGDPGLFATGFWWSSSSNNDQGWYRYLDYKKSNIFRYYGPKNYGFSIRCVKD